MNLTRRNSCDWVAMLSGGDNNTTTSPPFLAFYSWKRNQIIFKEEVHDFFRLWVGVEVGWCWSPADLTLTAIIITLNTINVIFRKNYVLIRHHCCFINMCSSGASQSYQDIGLYNGAVWKLYYSNGKIASLDKDFFSNGSSLSVWLLLSFQKSKCGCWPHFGARIASLASHLDHLEGDLHFRAFLSHPTIQCDHCASPGHLLINQHCTLGEGGLEPLRK